MVMPVDGEELWRMMGRGEDLIVVDARDPSDYGKGHLPGAVSLLLAEVDGKAASLLRKGVPVVVYSNDERCPASGLTAAKLDALGFGPVFDYNPSYADWVSRGYPLERVKAGS